MTTQPAADRGRIVIVSGIRVRNDAISNIICQQRRVLVDAGYRVDVIVQHRDSDPGAWETTSPHAWDLLRNPIYLAADLVIFHFGIFYDLFNALTLAHPRARRVVHFHNVTPPELLSGATRGFAQRGLVQLVTAEFADAVWSDSPHNTDVLCARTAIDPELVVPMAPSVPEVGGRQASIGTTTASTAPVRLISVGRFVPAKGLTELVAAIALLDPELRRDLRLTLAGSISNSDAEYFRTLNRQIADAGLTDLIDVASDPPDDELAALLWHSDILVSASHHEGFCVPVIEALATHCRVIVTDAGALPDTAGPCGVVVPAHDAAALSVAIADEIRAVKAVRAGDATAEAAERDRLDQAARHLEQFSPEQFRDRTLRAVEHELRLGAARSA
ncbi:MAG TPA: glycosyltransferase family 4 protein [Microthrixaceae bacterium]|jgi:glycosyltransferase involved in cell wall biosynthesis|nr:glycosyltransferase family 4 protein [Microthrixaceae bacterium]HQF93427.1 glycosyltransferase family 4 protein [Microthrixaceae bacterium]